MSKSKHQILIDKFNIFLILISLIVSLTIPFKLFLITYAILGPLHYLTEINWLKDKDYFLKSKKKWISIFIFVTLLISIPPTMGLFSFELSPPFSDFFKHVSVQLPAIFLTTFLFGISLIMFKKIGPLLISFFFSIVFAFLLHHFLPIPVIVFAIFIPTLLHVYIFTLLFILFGALKSKSKYGIYNAIVLGLVPMAIYLYPIDLKLYQPTKDVVDVFIDSNMISVSSTVAWILNGFENERFLPLSEIGIKIQIFITFAYTYHYLNWFSKTSVIGWKQTLTKRKSIWILSIWILSVSLYLYDYKTGFIALFFLSILHVLMEFPLNATTIKEIFLLSKNKRH